MRLKYCHHGFHKIYHSYHGSQKDKGRMKYVHYLKCRHCKYIFFAKKADKDKYLELTARERSAFTDWFSDVQLKQLSARVSDQEKEVSVR